MFLVFLFVLGCVLTLQTMIIKLLITDRKKCHNKRNKNQVKKVSELNVLYRSDF